jgi:probable DNA metabolism protein
MKILLCEPNFISFLTAVYLSFYRHNDAEFLTSDKNFVSFVDEAVNVESDFNIANKVRFGLTKKYGLSTYNLIYETYLCDLPEKENVIFNYIKLLIKHGLAAQSMVQNEWVLKFDQLNLKVSRDALRLIEFIRLREMQNGIYYGRFVSDHDVLELIVPHFKARFNVLKFVLHDEKRGKMVFYDGKKCHFGTAPSNMQVLLSEQEQAFSLIFKNYIKNMAIESRLNPKVQNNFMPKRYRVFMHELD